MKRVIVTGGRDYEDKDKVYAVLTALYDEIGEFILIQGGASGADRLADRWARDTLTLDPFHQEMYPADWEGPCDPFLCRMNHRRKRGTGTYCPAAGPRRNQKMLDLGADLVVAFPGGTGTADMVHRAQKAGVEVRRVG